MDYSLTGSSVHGVLKARIPESVAIPFSWGSSWPRDWLNLSLLHSRQILYHMSHQRQLVYIYMLLTCVWLFVTPWTVAHQAPQSLGFSRQEYWSGLPFPSPGELPDPGIEPRSPALRADALTSEPPWKQICENNQQYQPKTFSFKMYYLEKVAILSSIKLRRQYRRKLTP